MGTTGPKGPSFMMRVERGTFASIVGLKISVDSQFLRPRAVSNRVGPDLRPPHVRMLIKALAEPGASPPLPLSSGLARGPTSYVLVSRSRTSMLPSVMRSLAYFASENFTMLRARKTNCGKD